jgi:hypothetical protein
MFDGSYSSLANLAKPSLYIYIRQGSIEVIQTYNLTSNLRPLIKKGLSKYLLTI